VARRYAIHWFDHHLNFRASGLVADKISPMASQQRVEHAGVWATICEAAGSVWFTNPA
jgi:hypothetical protein